MTLDFFYDGIIFFKKNHTNHVCGLPDATTLYFVGFGKARNRFQYMPRMVTTSSLTYIIVVRGDETKHALFSSRHFVGSFTLPSPRRTDLMLITLF